MNDVTQSGDHDRTVELEQALTALAWADPAIAADPAAAFAQLGIDIPDGMQVDIRIQRPDTLYLIIPPVADNRPPEEVVNQLDLWRSGDQFVWMMSQDAKLALLQMRRQYRAHGREDES